MECTINHFSHPRKNFFRRSAQGRAERRLDCNRNLDTSDFHSGNFGIIRKVGTDAWRPAPMFDFEGSFGISYDDGAYHVLIANPELAKLFCARRFSFCDPSWDWSWYDPRALDGFEDHIAEALAANQNLLPEFGKTVTMLFAVQRAYVNRIASGE